MASKTQRLAVVRLRYRVPLEGHATTSMGVRLVDSDADQTEETEHGQCQLVA